MKITQIQVEIEKRIGGSSHYIIDTDEGAYTISRRVSGSTPRLTKWARPMENQDMINFVQAIKDYLPKTDNPKGVTNIDIRYALEHFLEEMLPKVRDMKINSLLS